MNVLSEAKKMAITFIKKWWWIIAALTIPIAINVGVTISPNTLSGDNNTWIQFWGSYLGGIFTLFAVWMTIQESRKQLREAKTANTNISKQIAISETTNQLTIIKNEKDLVYQIFKDANNNVLNIKITTMQTGITHEGLDGVRVINDILENGYQHIGASHAGKYDDIFAKDAIPVKKALSAYYYPLTTLTSNVGKYTEETLRFANDLSRSYVPDEITSLCATIIQNQSALEKFESDEAKFSQRSIVGLAINITNIPAVFIDEARSKLIRTESNK